MAGDRTEPCCAPASGKTSGGQAGADPAAGQLPNLIPLPGGTFLMGENSQWAYPSDGEGPCHQVRLAPFAIGRYTVTNRLFASFVAASGYQTDAERYGWSFVFAGLLPAGAPPTRAVANAPWWRQVEGADWRHPTGPWPGLDALPDHPVVHVSWDDAQQYCRWSRTRLPSEAEWEYAARAGSAGPFPWGSEPQPGPVPLMNIFHGDFPHADPSAHIGTAAVNSFPPNAFGLYNVTGNVWEWAADFYSPAYYGDSPRDNPPGPSTGLTRVMRGGSYLCHQSYCRRYRVSARQGSEPASSTGNLGFRVAADLLPG